MREAGEEQDYLLRFPRMLPTFDKPQRLFILAKGRCNHGATVIGIRYRRGLQIGHRGEQDGIVVAPFLLGSTNHPLARGPTEAMRAEDDGDLPPQTGGGLPGPQVLTQRPYPASVTDFGHHLRAATQDPIEHLGRPKAPVHAQDNPRPLCAGPPKVGFHLLQRRFQSRYGGRFAPQQGLVEYFPGGTCRDPQRFPPRFTAGASHPGALAPLCLGADGHGRHVDIHPQQALVEPMVGRRPVPFQIIPGHPLKLRHGVGGTRPQRPCNGGLLSAARAPKGSLDRRVRANRDVTLRNGLGPTEDPDQGIEDLVDRPVADRFLGDGHLLAERGEETPAPEILAEGAEARTPRVEDGRLRHGALLAGQGDFLIIDPMIGNIPLAGVRFRAFSAPMNVLLRGAKTWQLTAFEQAEMILYAALDPAVAGKAKKGDFVR